MVAVRHRRGVEGKRPQSSAERTGSSVHAIHEEFDVVEIGVCRGGLQSDNLPHEDVVGRIAQAHHRTMVYAKRSLN